MKKSTAPEAMPRVQFVSHAGNKHAKTLIALKANTLRLAKLQAASSQRLGEDSKAR